MMYRGKLLALWIGSIIAFSLTGCGRTDVTDYVPAETLALQSLTKALDAWKEGRQPDKIGVTNPAIEAQDAGWSGGQKLMAYEVIGPEKSPDQNLRFRVKLTIAGAAAPQDTVFVVFGKDPIWVFSQASYEKLSGM